MRSMLTHPPNPALAIRVGVAGTLEAVAGDALASQIHNVLDLIQDVASLHREPESGYDATVDPKLFLVCSLAAGADQFVAGIALERGYRLHVPLAYPLKKYMELNFGQNEQARKEFERLYGAAESKLELGGTEAEPYDVAGSVLVGHSDVLLAIWDLGPGKGPGGTADSVRKAIDARVPVVTLNSNGQGEPVLQHRVAGALKPESLKLEELRPILRDRLQEGLYPPHDFTPQQREQTDKQFREERESLRLFLEEKEKRIDWSPVYKIITGLLALRKPGLQFRLEPYADASERSWAPVPGTHPDCARRFFQAFDLWPDSLAVYYANWMRGIVSFSLIFGSLIIAYVLAGKLWTDKFPPWSEHVSTGIAMVSVFLIWWANHRSVHRRWLQYRMLSQDLRNIALALAIGVPPWQPSRYRTWADFQPDWVAFYTKACVRTFGVANALLDGAYLSDYRALLIDRLNGQYVYHWGRKELYRILNRHVRIVMFAVFLFTFSGALLSLLNAWILPKLRLHIADPAMENVVRFSLEFTVLSAAIAALAAQESFAKLAQASANTAIHLNQLGRDIETVPLTVAAMREQSERAREELRREHEDWYLLYSLREIDYS